MSISTKGRHILAEYRGCDADVLNDVERVETLLQEAARACGATVVNSVFHRFEPQGVTGIVLVEESHLSVHTWPEEGYASVDFYTCGRANPSQAHPVIAEGLGAASAELMLVHRGDAEAQMRVERTTWRRALNEGCDLFLAD